MIRLCYHCRDREAGKGVHAGPSWAVGRGCLQLWRAGGSCVCLFVCVCVCAAAAWTQLCFCSHSWCILCWSLWETQTNSGSLILFMPSMEEMWRSFRATSLPGANRWFYTFLTTQHEILDRVTVTSSSMSHDPIKPEKMYLLFKVWEQTIFPYFYNMKHAVIIRNVDNVLFGLSWCKML